MAKVSVVTRSKNESKDIQNLFKALERQTVQPIELIVVDNNSEDNSVKVAKELGFKVLSTDIYIPGKALNIGIAESQGDYVVLVSSHCIPTNSKWIENLVEPLLQDSSIAGAYGRQLPSISSTPNDIRDLYTIFGSESKLQTKDIFFHNANSVIRKSIWVEAPFSNTATNIEDRIWAKDVLTKGYKIYYSATAAVFHPHGVNHDGNQARAASLVKVFTDRNLYEHEKNEDWYQHI